MMLNGFAVGVANAVVVIYTIVQWEKLRRLNPDTRPIPGNRALVSVDPQSKNQNSPAKIE